MIKAKNKANCCKKNRRNVGELLSFVSKRKYLLLSVFFECQQQSNQRDFGEARRFLLQRNCFTNTSSFSLYLSLSLTHTLSRTHTFSSFLHTRTYTFSHIFISLSHTHPLFHSITHTHTHPLSLSLSHTHTH